MIGQEELCENVETNSAKSNLVQEDHKEHGEKRKVMEKQKLEGEPWLSLQW